MPVMDGIAATAAIRQGKGGVDSTIPIVAMTANVLLGDKDAYRDVGMDDYLPKPIKLESLKEVLRRCLPRIQEHHTQRVANSDAATDS